MAQWPPGQRLHGSKQAAGTPQCPPGHSSSSQGFDAGAATGSTPATAGRDADSGRVRAAIGVRATGVAAWGARAPVRGVPAVACAAGAEVSPFVSVMSFMARCGEAM